ncbi:MAG: hypothetical protein AAGA42_11660 [Actinomycetota bacterium]
MKKKFLAIAAAGGLILAACGDDDGGGGSSSDLSSDQQSAADAAIDAAAEGELQLDRDCVEEIASQLSDDDAAAIVASGGGGDAELSDEGAALSLDLLNCADNEAIIDTFIDGLEQSGQPFDEGCVREGLEDFDASELAAAGQTGEIPDDLITGLIDCFELGG